MAKGKKTGGRDFTKGDPRAGRPKLPDEIRGLNHYSSATVKSKLAEFLNMSLDELEGIARDRSRPMLEHWVARVIITGVKAGDHVRLDFMFNRLIGKVTDKVEHKGATPVLIEYSSGEKIMMSSEEEES